MEKEIIEVLQRYYEQLNDEHKEHSKIYRQIKKEKGIKEANSYYSECRSKKSFNIHNNKEKKLHIKRLIKLMYNEME